MEKMVKEWWKNGERMVKEWWQNGDKMVTNEIFCLWTHHNVWPKMVTKWWPNGFFFSVVELCFPNTRPLIIFSVYAPIMH
mgnify:CR=1 FL=1